MIVCGLTLLAPTAFMNLAVVRISENVVAYQASCTFAGSAFPKDRLRAFSKATPAGVGGRMIASPDIARAKYQCGASPSGYDLRVLGAVHSSRPTTFFG